MRLARLDLTRYGKFTDHTLDFGERVQGSPDFHVVYGLNEAGKSTAFSAFLDLLYGIEERSRYGFLHAYGAMEIGAALDIDGHRHELRRVKQRSGSLRDASGQPIGESLLGGALTGLSREAYRLMFSLDDQTLEDGGNAILDSKGDLGELLFSASAGLAGLSRALAAVSTEADGIFRKRASSTEIAGLKRRLADLKAARDAIDTQAGTHAALVAALKSAEQDYDEAAKERGRLKARHDELAGLLRAEPIATEYAGLGERLAETEALPRPPGHWTTQLPALMVAEATLKARLAGMNERLERLASDIAAITVDERVLRLSARIEALAADAARFRVASLDLPKRRAALLEKKSRLAQIAVSITDRHGDEDPDALIVDAGTLGTLRALIERWSGIEATLAATIAERESAASAADRAREEHALLERNHPPLGLALKAQLHTIVKRIREADLLARRRVAAGVVQAKARAMDEALAALTPWSGTPAELASLNVPTPAGVSRLRDDLVEFERRSSHHREQQRQAGSELVELEAKAAAAAASIGAISDEEATLLKQERDTSWSSHRDLLTQASAISFEQAMRAVDTMADARLVAADGLAELRSLRRDMAVCQARSERESTLLAEVDGEIAEFVRRTELACPAGIAAGSQSLQDRIATLEDWTLRRERALLAVRELSAAESDLRQVAAEIERERSALETVVAAAEMQAQGLDLAVLLHAAEEILSADIARALAKDNAEAALRDAVRSLEVRQKAALDAEDTRLSWTDQWTQALSRTPLADRGLGLGAVRAILDVLAGLPAALADRDEILHRIDAMEADQASYLAELGALRGEMGAAGGELSADAAGELTEQLSIAMRAHAARLGKEAERVELEQARQALVTEMSVHDAGRNELTAFFGVADLVEVAERLERCASRDRIEEERRKLAAQILRDTGSASLDLAFSRLGETGKSDRTQQHADGAKRLDHLDERLQALFATRSAAEDRLKAVGGDDAVLRIEAERRTITLQIEERANHFLQLRTGAMLAERALDIYRDKHRGSMMRRASEAFRAVTCDAYSGLATRPEKDRDTLIGISDTGSKLATDMSKGTRFQLYLALRLAGYEEFATTRQPVPFVADDIMETFDEPRSEQVLAQFGKMAMTGQVIYLTHHRHICEMARKVVPQVVVHALS
jgi:uncharacterized protein YhaN